VTVVGAGETVRIACWSARRGIWYECIDIPARGWTIVDVVESVRADPGA
jgi:hypothetical protein